MNTVLHNLYYRNNIKLIVNICLAQYIAKILNLDSIPKEMILK